VDLHNITLIAHAKDRTLLDREIERKRKVGKSLKIALKNLSYYIA
jgi:hypothetical protein